MFTAHLVSNCLSVVFWSNDFLCLSDAGTLRGTELKDQITPTWQSLPIMSTKCCSGDGEERKDKGGGGGPRSKTKLCV